MLSLFDNRGKRYQTRLRDVGRTEMVAEILAVEEIDTQGGEISVGQAILKGEKMDWFIQKATELGVAGIVPLLTERTVAGKTGLRQQRWQKIALEAAQQSGRCSIPSVSAPHSLSSFLTEASTSDLKLLLWEGEEEKKLKEVLRGTQMNGERPGRISLLIGPEGGWTAEEVSVARRAGFATASLGRGILRAETAGVAALAILQYELS